MPSRLTGSAKQHNPNKGMGPYSPVKIFGSSAVIYSPLDTLNALSYVAMTQNRLN